MSKVYVLGDFGLDKYFIGRVRGMSAEVPIPVVTVTQRETLPAMAANVVANLRALGATVVPLRTPSTDTYSGCPIKNRLVTDHGVQLARWDEHDVCLPYSVSDLVPLMHADAVVVADYAKGSVTPQVAETLGGLTLPLFVDTKHSPAVWHDTGAILFPNLVEYKRFESDYNAQRRVVLKMGAEGIAYLEYGKVVFSYPTLAEAPQCVNGAGDTVIAAYTLASLSGLPQAECVEFANAAAACVVEQPPLERTTCIQAVLARLDIGIEDTSAAQPVEWGLAGEPQTYTVDLKNVN